MIECPFTYTYNAIGDCDTCKAGANSECIITYTFDAVGDGDALKFVATAECIITYTCNALGDYNVGCQNSVYIKVVGVVYRIRI